MNLYKKSNFHFFGIFLIFNLYGHWEAVHSLKTLSRGVGTFSNIENFILRTSIFRHFFDPRSRKAGRSFSKREPPQARPALRKAGRSFSKSGSFVFKSWPNNLRSLEKFVETCPFGKRRDPLCAKQVAPFRGNPKKVARPALHWPGSSKTNKYIDKSWRKAGRTFPRQPLKRSATRFALARKQQKQQIYG